MVYLSTLLLPFALLAGRSSAQEEQDASQSSTSSSSSYGVDCSMPIHNLDFGSHDCGHLLGDRKTRYNEFIEGCREEYGFRCEHTEIQRVNQLNRQPQSLLNYTAKGYDKIKAPVRMMQAVNDHWRRNEDQIHSEDRIERWTKGHTYVNYWQKNTTYHGMVNPKCGGSMDLQYAMFALAKPILEEWTGMELKPTSLYGIRVYQEGAILMPHVDRNPLIASAIINVAQDPDMTEDWPLEIYDRQGQAVNISMVPGDMVLYESGTLIHGRPFPLQGKYYANVFVHFEPTGRLLKDIDKEEMKYDSPQNPAGYQSDVRLPPYVIPGSPEAYYFSRFQPWGWGNEEVDFNEDWGDDDEEEWSDDDSEDDDEEWESSDEEGSDSEDDLFDDEEDWEWEHYDNDEDGDYLFEEEVLKRSQSSENDEDEETPSDTNTEINNKPEEIPTRATPSCPSNMDPTTAPSECLTKFSEERIAVS